MLVRATVPKLRFVSGCVKVLSYLVFEGGTEEQAREICEAAIDTDDYMRCVGTCWDYVSHHESAHNYTCCAPKVTKGPSKIQENSFIRPE